MKEDLKQIGWLTEWDDGTGYWVRGSVSLQIQEPPPHERVRYIPIYILKEDQENERKENT
jgi:hypothetical protein